MKLLGKRGKVKRKLKCCGWHTVTVTGVVEGDKVFLYREGEDTAPISFMVAKTFNGCVEVDLFRPMYFLINGRENIRSRIWRESEGVWV